MELVKEVDGNIIYKKRNGRYGVKNAQRKWLNGEAKVEVLLKEGLIKVTAPAPKEEPAPEEAAAEETTEEVKEELAE